MQKGVSPACLPAQEASSPPPALPPQPPPLPRNEGLSLALGRGLWPCGETVAERKGEGLGGGEWVGGPGPGGGWWRMRDTAGQGGAVSGLPALRNV